MARAEAKHDSEVVKNPIPKGCLRSSINFEDFEKRACVREFPKIRKFTQKERYISK